MFLKLFSFILEALKQNNHGLDESDRGGENNTVTLPSGNQAIPIQDGI